MRTILPLLIVLLLLPNAASAQRGCSLSLMTTDAGEAMTSWTFDGAGRVRRVEEDNYFFSMSEAYRYDGRGRMSHVNLLQAVGGGADDFVPPGPVAVQRGGEGNTVTLERPFGLGMRREVATFDRRGFPSRIQIHDGSRRTDHTCTYDVEGRPIHRRTLFRPRPGGDGVESNRRWLWRGGRLSEVVDNDVRFRVHFRGDSVHVAGTPGAERERWHGQCAQVFFDVCAPALRPRPPNQRRVRLPPLRARRPRIREARRQPPLAPASLARGRLSLARIRRAYPGYEVWTSVRFGENDPGHAIAIVCVGSDCATYLDHDDNGRLRSTTSRDPMFGYQIGEFAVERSGDEVYTELEDCHYQALEGNIRCGLRARPNTHATLLADEGREIPTLDEETVVPVETIEDLELRVAQVVVVNPD